jgi:hypothetical protein
MRNANEGLAERDWEIFIKDSGGSNQTKIAHLSLKPDNNLVFQWQEEARNDPSAAFLSNCALSFNCRGDTHVAVLRQATQVQAMELNLKEAIFKGEWPIDAPPDPERIRMEIKGLTGAKFTIEPQPVVNADKGEAWVKLDDGGGLLALKIESELRKDFELTATPHIMAAKDARPERLNIRKLQQYKNQLQAAVAQWSIQVKNLEAITKSKAPEPQKKQAAAHLRNFQNELNTSQETLKKFEEFEKMLENTKPKLSFRLFFDADGSEVDLLRVGT